jgi:hypothetical protein
MKIKKYSNTTYNIKNNKDKIWYKNKKKTKHYKNKLKEKIK